MEIITDGPKLRKILVAGAYARNWQKSSILNDMVFWCATGNEFDKYFPTIYTSKKFLDAIAKSD